MATDEKLQCWRCGEDVSDISLPFGRSDYCRACRADLHVCRMCTEYDAKRAEKCRAELSDVPFEKERANFCDHFTPSCNAYQPKDTTEADRARTELNALFGVADNENPQQAGESKAEAARRELEALFNTPKKEPD